MAKVKRRRRRKRHYHTGTHQSPKAGDCKYRSGWELSYMQWLDGNADVVTYSYEKTKIPYVSNLRSGKLRTYYPDFLVEYVDGRRVLVEIKPKRRVAQAQVVKKLRAAEAWSATHGLTLEVITEVELRLLGLLK